MQSYTPTFAEQEKQTTWLKQSTMLMYTGAFQHIFESNMQGVNMFVSDIDNS